MDGMYEGRQSAYTVTVLMGGQPIIDARVDQGIRGVNCKTTVVIKEGWLYTG